MAVPVPVAVWQTLFEEHMLNARFTGEILGHGSYGVVEKVTKQQLRQRLFSPSNSVWALYISIIGLRLTYCSPFWRPNLLTH